jgi:hypothetical protein
LFFLKSFLEALSPGCGLQFGPLRHCFEGIHFVLRAIRISPLPERFGQQKMNGRILRILSDSGFKVWNRFRGQSLV